MSGTLNRQINSMTHTLMHEIQSERSQYLNAMSASEDRLLRAFEVATPSVASTAASTLTSNPPPLSVNATLQDTVSLEVLKLLKEIKGALSVQNNSGNTNRKGKNQKRHRPDVSKYCWTHGAWNHLGKDCRWKKDGHKDDATFQNKLGGSSDCCSGSS